MTPAKLNNGFLKNKKIFIIFAAIFGADEAQ